MLPSSRWLKQQLLNQKRFAVARPQALIRPASSSSSSDLSHPHHLSTSSDASPSVVEPEGDDLHESLARLHVMVDANRSTLRLDNVLADIRKSNDMDKVIPLTLFFDAATMFARRHDSLRMELLLRLAKTNLLREQSNNSSNVLTAGNRSQPHHAPFDKFMSFGLSEMIRCGNLEDALKLWVRISNGSSGYLTSRHSLDKIVKKAATCGAKELPPIEFTDKIHRMMRMSRWDQARGYYVNILAVYRQHVSWAANVNQLEKACDRLEQIWDEQKALSHRALGGSAIDSSSSSEYDGWDAALELQAMKVSAWTAAASRAQQLLAVSRGETATTSSAMAWTGPNGGMVAAAIQDPRHRQNKDKGLHLKGGVAEQKRISLLVERCRRQALADFTSLLQSPVPARLTTIEDNATASSSSSSSSSMFHQLVHSVNKALLEVPVQKASISSSTPTPTPTMGFPSEQLKELLKKSDLPLRDPSSHMDEPSTSSSSSSSSASIPKNVTPRSNSSPSVAAARRSSAINSPHHEASRPLGLLRKAVADALLQMAASPSDSSSGVSIHHAATSPGGEGVGNLPSSSPPSSSSLSHAVLHVRMICGYLDMYLCHATAASGSSRSPNVVHANSNDSNATTAMRTRAGASREAFTLSDAEWLETLFCDILRQARFDNTLDSSHDNDHSVDVSNNKQKNKDTTKGSNQARGGSVSLLSPEDRQRNHIECVALLARELRSLAQRHHVSLGTPFHAAHIEALAGPSMGGSAVLELGGYLSDGSDKGLSGCHPGGGGWDWQVSFSAAQELVDGMDDCDRGSLEVYHGLVSLLCHPAVATGASVDRALRLAAYELVDDAPGHRRHPNPEPPLLSSSSSSSGGGGAGGAPQPFPDTWRVILEASVRVHQDEELRQTLAIVEERCSQLRCVGSSPNKSASSSSESSSSTASSHPDVSTALASARLRCYARLRMGYAAMNMLRTVRAATATPTTTQSNPSLNQHQDHHHYTDSPNQPPTTMIRLTDRHTYTWLVNAVHHCRPSNESEWRIVKDPTATCEWLLGEMLRDGIEANSHSLALLLKLHGKACQIARSQGAVEAQLRRMEAFVQACAAGGLKGHPKMPVNEAVVREMVKIYCIVGQEEKALELLQSAEATYSLTLTAAAYEPLVFHYALLEKQDGSGRPLALAEDALTLIVNRGLTPSDAIADALLLGHLRRILGGGLAKTTTTGSRLGPVSGTGTGAVGSISGSESSTKGEGENLSTKKHRQRKGVVGGNSSGNSGTSASSSSGSSSSAGSSSGVVAAECSDALDRVQGLFTAHGIRPSCSAILRLLDAVLDTGDVHEARRVVVVIEQLFSEEDRRRSVHYPFATHRRQLSHQNKRTRKGESASQQADRAILGADAEGQGLGLDDDGNDGLDGSDLHDQGLGVEGGVDIGSLDHKKRLERWQRQRLDASLEQPFEHSTLPAKIDDYYINGGEDFEDDNLLSLQLSNSTSSNPGGPSLASRSVVPAEYGALTTAALQARFALRGMSIK